MAKKQTTKDVQEDLKDSAHRVWLAGLGALAAAEEEGGKLFKKLVEKGEKLESRGKERLDEAKDKAGDVWTEVEKKMDDAVTKALHRIGVPSRDEIRNLTKRVEELSAKVEARAKKATTTTTAARSTRRS